jgi:hypothetical protein
MDLENFVLGQIHLLLQAPDKFTAGMHETPERDAVTERAGELAKKWPKLEISKQREFVRIVLNRVMVGKAAVWIEIDQTNLVATLLEQDSETLSPTNGRKHDILKLSGGFRALRRGGQLRVIGPQDAPPFEGTRVPSLVKAIARARDWYERIAAGEITTMAQLSQESGLRRRYLRKILHCATLSPQTTEALLLGRHQPNLSLKEILQDVPLDWREQEKTIFRIR